MGAPQEQYRGAALAAAGTALGGRGSRMPHRPQSRSPGPAGVRQ
jgi:hypothetical protein